MNEGNLLHKTKQWMKASDVYRNLRKIFVPTLFFESISIQKMSLIAQSDSFSSKQLSTSANVSIKLRTMTILHF